MKNTLEVRLKYFGVGFVRMLIFMELCVHIEQYCYAIEYEGPRHTIFSRVQSLSNAQQLTSRISYQDFCSCLSI